MSTPHEQEPEPGFSAIVNAGVLELTFNRPDRRNPMDYHTVEGLVAALRRADADPLVRSILIRGEGKGFTSGGDLSEFQAQLGSSALTFQETGAAWTELLTLVPALSKPVVAAAHGFAMAGGVGLVAAADVAVAAEGTFFATSEVKIGLFPVMILPTLQRAVGARQAGALALTGRRIDAQEALRMGLIHQVLPQDGFDEAARAIASELASYGTTTIALGKAYLNDINGLPTDKATQFGRAVRGSFMSGPDLEEGLAAFLEKRKPEFK